MKQQTGNKSAVITAWAVALAVSLSCAWAAPVALVEDVSPGMKDVQTLSYVASGQVIDLGKDGKLTLGYLGSCAYEQIVGGRVTVGDRESQVRGGKVVRTKVECDGGRLILAANQAVHSGATAVREVDTSDDIGLVIHHVSPLFLLPKVGRVVVKRLDVSGERHTLKVDDDGMSIIRLDLSERDIQLTPGGRYMVSSAGLARRFQISPDAAQDQAPLLGRLVPF